MGHVFSEKVGILSCGRKTKNLVKAQYFLGQSSTIQELNSEGISSFSQYSLTLSTNFKKCTTPTHQESENQEQSHQFEESMTVLEELFCLSGCTTRTQMTSKAELDDIVSNVQTCGGFDNENYFYWLNENNETVLEVAIKAGNSDMVELLIQKGDYFMFSEAILYACIKGEKNVVQLLLKSHKLESLDRNTEADCILECTKNGDTTILSMLCNSGFRLSKTCNFVNLKSAHLSNTPRLWLEGTNGSLLHIAAANGHHLMVDFLINQNADIESVDSNGRKPIHLAIQGGIYCLRRMLHAGADIDATDYDGHSALFLAASFGDFLAVKTLVDNGAEVDQINLNGVSALVAAALCNRDGIVKYLLNTGAIFTGVRTETTRYSNLCLSNAILQTAVHRTERHVTWSTLNMLEESGNVLSSARIRLHLGIDPEVILGEAVRKEQQQVVKLLLELDYLESCAMLALNCGSLKAYTELILIYAYPRRVSSSLLLRALQELSSYAE